MLTGKCCKKCECANVIQRENERFSIVLCSYVFLIACVRVFVCGWVVSYLVMQVWVGVLVLMRFSICVRTFVRLYAWVFVCLFIFMFVRLCIYVSVCLCVCLSVSVCAWVCLCDRGRRRIKYKFFLGLTLSVFHHQISLLWWFYDEIWSTHVQWHDRWSKVEKFKKCQRLSKTKQRSWNKSY